MSILQVAKRAGVSVATVSRVINRFPGVSPNTLKQVQTAMKELAYVPAEVRPGPKPGSRRVVRSPARVGTIVVLTVGQTSREWLGLPLMASALAGITAAAKEYHVRLLIDEMPDPDQVTAVVSGREVDGAIVFWSSRLGNRALDSLRSHTVPLVWLMGAIDKAAPIDHVTTDNIAIGHLAHEHLQSLGCNRVAFVTEFPEWPLMRLRGQSFANAARDAGHQVTSYVVGADPAVAGNYGPNVLTARTVEELVEQLVANSATPCGIFSATDKLTLKLYPLLKKHGLMPGKDFPLVSCDNQESLLSGLTPRPASIDLRPEEIGQLAVSRLMNRLEHPNEAPLLIQVPPSLQFDGKEYQPMHPFVGS